MKGKFLVSVLLSILLVSMAGLTGCPDPVDDNDNDVKVYKLTIQSIFPRGDIGMEMLHDFAESAYERSDGRLDISVYAEPEIVGMWEGFTAVKMGTLDMMQGCGAFWGPYLPISEIEFGIPYSYDIPEEETFEGKFAEIHRFFHEDGFVEILRSEYAKHNMYWLDVAPAGPCTLHSKRVPPSGEGVTMDYFAGQIVRDEGLWRVFHERLGMTGSDIYPGDVYTALAMCTLDATQWDVSAITGLGWHEHAPYWIHPHQNEMLTLHLVVNMDAWNALPADLQEALAGAARDYKDACVEAYSADLEAAYGYEGVEVIWMTPETDQIWRETALELWDELAEQDDACAAAIALIKEWRGME